MLQKILFILFLFIIPIQSFGYTGDDLLQTDENKSIKELHTDIQDLKAEKKILSDNWEIFNKENTNINDFIKKDFSPDDVKAVEGFLGVYFTKKTQLELELKEATKNGSDTQEIKTQLVTIKLDFFKALTPYIRIEKLKDYLSYIKENIEVIKEDKNIKEEIYKKEEILDKKVEAIKEKIKENNIALNEKIKILVGQKLEEKIYTLVNNPKFLHLTKEQKRYVFEKTLEKISQKKNSLKTIYDGTSLVIQKIELYEIVEEKLKKNLENYQ